MAIQPTFLLIADIGGYTRFMKFHRASLAHAQEIVAQLLEAVIDATQRAPQAREARRRRRLLLSSRGRAAPSRRSNSSPSRRRRSTARSTARASDLKINTLCVCDGCQQAGNLKIKLVGHFGEAAVQKVKHLTELAGVDVILVHRLLKNDVPVPGVHADDRARAPPRRRHAARARASACARARATSGRRTRSMSTSSATSTRCRRRRSSRSRRSSCGTGGSPCARFPALIGLVEACVGFRNIDRTKPSVAGGGRHEARRTRSRSSPGRARGLARASRSASRRKAQRSSSTTSMSRAANASRAKSSPRAAARTSAPATCRATPTSRALVAFALDGFRRPRHRRQQRRHDASQPADARRDARTSSTGSTAST